METILQLPFSVDDLPTKLWEHALKGTDLQVDCFQSGWTQFQGI